MQLRHPCRYQIGRSITFIKFWGELEKHIKIGRTKKIALIGVINVKALERIILTRVVSLIQTLEKLLTEEIVIRQKSVSECIEV